MKVSDTTPKIGSEKSADLGIKDAQLIFASVWQELEEEFGLRGLLRTRIPRRRRFHQVNVPERFDVKTGAIECRVKKVYRIQIRFPSSEIRWGRRRKISHGEVFQVRAGPAGDDTQALGPGSSQHGLFSLHKTRGA